MKNLVNSYDLDFIRDIPNELIDLQTKCETLKETNGDLKFALIFVTTFGATIGIAFALSYYYNKTENDLSAKPSNKR